MFLDLSLEFFFLLPYLALQLVSPLDGMARNFFFYMYTQEHAIHHVWIHLIPTSLYPRREKTIWSELELNPGPLASQATALTTRPWLLGQICLWINVKPYLNVDKPALMAHLSWQISERFYKGHWLQNVYSLFSMAQLYELISYAVFVFDCHMDVTWLNWWHCVRAGATRSGVRWWVAWMKMVASSTFSLLVLPEKDSLFYNLTPFSASSFTKPNRGSNSNKWVLQSNRTSLLILLNWKITKK